MSHFLLTEKLRPLLEKSSKNPRIIQISSSFHWLAGSSDLSSVGGAAPHASRGDVNTFLHRERAYALSKLAQIMHSRSLSRELEKVGSIVKVVNVCPGWVGTSIGGKSNQPILKALGYPSNGFGLASAFEAMSHPDAGVAGNDWVVNGKLFELFGRLSHTIGIDAEWTSDLGLRDIYSWVCAVAALYAQKFFPGVYWTKSSPQSYDTSVQESLYQWSTNTISEWL